MTPPLPPHGPALPIDAHLPEVLAHLRARGVVVVEAPPGAGKTTRIPPAILDAMYASMNATGDAAVDAALDAAVEGAGSRGGDVVVLQPRRLATRLAARRVAAERGERLGGTVGYQVRFEEVAGPRTRLRFVTEGILARRLAGDPALRGAGGGAGPGRVGCVVLDEFHERHLATDVALALLRRLRETTRPDLRLVVMSATLDAAPVAAFLGGAPRVRAEGRAWPVEVEHLAAPDDRPLERQVAGAVSRLLAEGLDGDVLVFLPGAAEIRRARDACAAVAARDDLLLLPLHGDLPLEAQDEAVRPATRRKVILSTNVAETSITIDGVAAVVDSGLARVASHSPWSGLSLLRTEKVSRASAAQRAGRAGRTRAGRCLRLYTRADHDRRPAFDTPEVLRADLASTVLELRALGEDPPGFPWFEPPAPEALRAAEELLRRLGAVNGSGRVTDLGRRMLAFPLHPRLARLVIEAGRRGALRIGVRAAAALGERDLRRSARVPDLGRGGGGRGGAGGTGGGRAPHVGADAGPSDVLARVDALAEGERLGGNADRLRAAGIDPGTFHAVQRAAHQIAGIARDEHVGRGDAPERGGGEESALALAVLSAFPDRVARRRTRGRPEVLLSGGGAATLAPESAVSDAEWMVVVEAEERPRGAPLVRAASAVDPEALLEMLPDRVREERCATWNVAAERVEVSARVLYDDLVLEERRRPASGEPEAEALLRERVLAAGPEAFAEPAEVARLLARVALVAGAFPERGLPALGEEDVRAALGALCAGRSSFEEVRRTGLLGALEGRLSAEQRRLVDRMAPARVRFPGGAEPRVGYAPGRPPWVAVPIQDCFGEARGPTVCGGRVAVVLHLLAPSRRPVQVTTDLAGFWERHYPGLCRELSRRYPRHDWPEDPLAASPPRRRAGRRRAPGERGLDAGSPDS